MSWTDDSRRHILLDGQTNFRDLGGYATAAGRTLKWGQVYRSGRLVKLTDDDLLHLTQLGLRTVVNLLTEDGLGLSEQELSQSQDTLIQ